MTRTLALSGNGPVYEQILRAIAEPIVAGHWRPGRRIPSEMELTKAFKQTFYVENHAGAGGNIGTALAANAPPDGYTLIMGTVATHTMNEHMYSSLGYKPDEQFEPISMTGMLPMVISANPSSPYKSIRDLIEADKREPGKLNVALPSTTARIVYELTAEGRRQLVHEASHWERMIGGIARIMETA